MRHFSTTLAVAVLLVALVALPTGAETGGDAALPAVDAGSLRALVTADPWKLTFVDDRGDTVLGEAVGTGLEPVGPLGFRTAAGWWRATRVLSDERHPDRYEALLATTDPLRTIALVLRRDGEGVIALEASVQGASLADVTALGLGFEADVDERYLGFGERSNAVDQRGNVLESYVGEGTYPLEERPFLMGIVPHWGMQPRDDATYFPIPWLLSTSGYGVLIDNTETSYYRLGTDRPDAWSLEVVGAPANQPTGAGAPPPEQLDVRFFSGPRPADALRRFTDAIGRQPAPAAPWYFGPWMQPVGGGNRGRVDELRAADVPVSVAQTFSRYLPCGGHRDRRAAERQRTTALHNAGVAVTTYMNNMICTSFTEPYEAAAAGDGLTRDPAGEPYVYRYPNWPHFAAQQDLRYTQVSQFDFTSPTGREVFKSLLHEGIEDGYDGWMQDYGEYTPLDARSFDGTHGSRMHNLYPVLYHCTSAELAEEVERPLARFIRSGFTGVAPCAEIVWGGDPTTAWGFDGLESAVYNGLTMGLSGISLWGSDIGGLFANGLNSLSPELKVRWIEFGAVSGIMRDQAGQFAVPDTPDKARPQIWDADILPHWRRYAKLRTQLYPYLVAADREYQRSGMPIMRHHLLTHPDDPEAVVRHTQFLFGPDLLAAPVTEADQSWQDVYLPQGRWIDFWRAVRYDEATGAFHLGSAVARPGGREVTVAAPLGELPLHVRAGAVLPLLPPDVDTLADHGSAPDLVRLADREDVLRLLAFPRGESRGSFGEDGWLRSVEGTNRWTLEVSGAITRMIELEASLATLESPFRACQVRVDGRPLARDEWRYDEATGVLTATVQATTTAVVVVQGCGPQR